MDSARPGRRGRRLSRGATDNASHTRLARMGLLVVAPAVLALLFALSSPGRLPPPPLEPLFDGEATAALAESLSTQYPERVPGTPEAEGAAIWYEETVAALGLQTEQDAWEEDLPDLGTVTLRNVVTVVPGRSDEVILVLAHRDNAGPDEPHGDNAAGTAALVELAKGFAPQPAGPDPTPNRTLVFVSTDAGMYGGAGAARFAESSPYADRALAAVVIDGLSGAGTPRLAISGDVPSSSSRALVTTAGAAIAGETGSSPSLPSLATQLANFAFPFAEEEQGRLLAEDIAAISISSTGHGRGASPPEVGPMVASTQRIERLGRATESLVDSLDASLGAPFRTPDTLYFRDRALSGWAVRLTLILLVVPFALGLADLLARARRHAVPLRPALRSLRTRVLVWGFAGLLVGLGALTDVFPTGSDHPLPPFSKYVTEPDLAGIAVLVLLLLFAWLLGRRRLLPHGPVSDDDRLAGLVVALSLLGLVALVLAFLRPYALLFVLPSLYAWLWIQPQQPAWLRTALLAVGLVGPVAGLALVGRELDLAVAETPLYAVGLVTVGYLPLGSALLALAWAAVTAQIAAIAVGRYGPYAGGAEPPPPGIVRLTVSSIAERQARQSSAR